MTIVYVLLVVVGTLAMLHFADKLIRELERMDRRRYFQPRDDE